jgi:CBS domain-containing protein
VSVSALLRSKPKQVFTIPSSARLGEAADLLTKHNIGGVPIVGADGRLTGFLSEKDVVRAVAEHASEVRSLPVAKVMRSPAPTCRADDQLQAVMARMTRERIRHLVVEGDEGILGVISVGDLVKNRLEQLETETGVLRDYVAAQRARG